MKKNIVYSGAVSFSWILNSSNIAESNDTFKQILNEYEHKHKARINNGATLLAFSYLALVFPRESDLLSDIININYEKFNIQLDKKKSCNSLQVLLRRLRNSISHANIEIDNNGNFTFIDGQLKDGQLNIDFKATISATDFGNFLLALLLGVEKKVKS